MRAFLAAFLLCVACGSAAPSAPIGLSDPCSATAPCSSGLLCGDMPGGGSCITPRLNGQGCPTWGIPVAWNGGIMVTGSTGVDFGGAVVFAGCLLRCPNKTDAECPAHVTCIDEACRQPVIF